MQAFGQFQLTHKSAVRTWLRVPAGCHSANLAAVRRRLAACDGIVAVEANLETGSLVISHSPAFSWNSIGAAAWRLGEGNAPPAPAGADRAGTLAPAAHQPSVGPLEELLALALESVMARRQPAQILRDVALGVIVLALRESRRA